MARIASLGRIVGVLRAGFKRSERFGVLAYVLGGFAAGLVMAAAYVTFDPAMVTAGGILMLALTLAVLAVGRFAERTGARLLDREFSYRAFFDNAVEGAFRTTPDGRYLAVNRALARMYGYDSKTELMDALTDIKGQLYVDPAMRDEFLAKMTADLQVTDFVYEIRRRDGSTFWIQENARAVCDYRGRIVCYEGMIEDVTLKIAAERAVRDALREAEAANRAKIAFLSSMSHELRTPLNAIIGFSEIVKDELLGPSNMPAYRDYAGDIHVSGVRLLAIINDILDASKLEGGNVVLACEPCDMRILAQDAVDIARTLTGDAREIVFEVPPGLPKVAVDPNRFQQCLVKLLTNALKFTPPGGTVAVRAGLEGDGGLRIAVTDAGIGMEHSLIAAALEPFNQLDGSLARRFGGTGLGLSITKALIDLHGCCMNIESEIGDGTTVTVTVPPALVQPDDEQAAVA